MNKSIRPIFVLTLIAIILSLPFISNQLLLGHDTQIHGVRVVNYYLALKQGQFPPQWAPNMNWGFGYPVFIFSYPLPYTLGSVLYAVTNSVERALNLSFILSILLATWGTYFLVDKYIRSNFYKILAVLIYLLSPYFLFTLYLRGAVAEALFLSFLPWVLGFLPRDNKQTNWQLLGFYLSLTALLFSHHVSFLVGLPLIFGFLVFQVSARKINKLVFSRFMSLLIISILTTSFYWVPSLLESHLIEVAGDVYTSTQTFLTPSNLWWQLWDCQQFCYSWQHRPTPTFLGPSAIVIIMLSLFFLVRRKQLNNVTAFWVFASTVSILLMLPFSLFLWQVLPIIGMLEFAWLLLWIPSIGSVFGFIYLIKNLRSQFLKSIIISMVLAQSFFALLNWTAPESKFHMSEQDWLHFGDITQNYDGLLPKTFDSNRNLKLDRKLVVRIIGEKTYPDPAMEQPLNGGETEQESWSGTKMQYLATATQSAEVIQKTMYFPGWHAYVNDQEVKINYDDQEFPGRVIIPISAGKNQIKVEYKGNTWARNLGKILTIIGLIGLGGWLMSLLEKKSNRW